MQEALNFILVLLLAVCVAGSLSSLYASGLRLWAKGSVDAEGRPHLAPRIGSAVCFAACIAIVIFALWLMIPLFH